MKKPIISLKNISRHFVSGLGEKTVILKELNLEIKPGSFNVIKGESGSGKTTLLRILGMLDCKFDGSYEIGGHSVKGQPDWFLDELRAENIGFIFQEGRLFDHMPLQRNVILPLQLHLVDFKWSSAKKTVNKLASRFFHKQKRDKVLPMMPSAVSGGERQRISIMRAIISNPSIILADEPTASLNGDLKNDVVEYLHELCESGHTVIVVSHDEVFYDKGRQLELVDGHLEENNE